MSEINMIIMVGSLIDKLMDGTFSKEQFALEFNVGSTYVKQLLEVAYDEKK